MYHWCIDFQRSTSRRERSASSACGTRDKLRESRYKTHRVCTHHQRRSAATVEEQIITINFISTAPLKAHACHKNPKEFKNHLKLSPFKSSVRFSIPWSRTGAWLSAVPVTRGLALTASLGLDAAGRCLMEFRNTGPTSASAVIPPQTAR